jgi:hypothetical protein
VLDPLRQLAPDLDASAEVVPLIDDLLREALEELATDGDGDVDDDA